MFLVLFSSLKVVVSLQQKISIGSLIAHETYNVIPQIYIFVNFRE